MGAKWEFPGGKVEPDESEESALIREIAEELGCAVEVGGLVCRHRHRYPELEVELAFYRCTFPAGEEPRLIGVDALEWVAPERLSTYDFLEADLPVLPRLAAG
jgi:8-oxo-dGTP diphosphatase